MQERSTIVSCYQFLNCQLNRTTNAIHAIHSGLWLGLFANNRLNQTTQRGYSNGSRYLDTQYNLSGLSSWEAKVFAKHYTRCRSILVGAAGGGRELLALARDDVTVDAFECNPSLVNACRRLVAQHRLETTIIHTEPGRAPVASRKYDGIIIGWGGYMHIPGRDNRVRFLRELRAVCNDGVPILLSFFTRNANAGLRLHWTYSIANAIRKLKFSDEQIELGDYLSDTFEHYFTQQEVEAELTATGFRLVEYSAHPYGHAVGIAI